MRPTHGIRARLALAAMLMAGCGQAAAAGNGASPMAQVPIIPRPAHVEALPGRFTMTADTPIVAVGADPEVARIARDFAKRLQRIRGFAPSVSVSAHAPQSGAVVFILDPRLGLPGEEAYRLVVKSDGVRVSARAPAGLFYGAVSLWQLATADGASGPATLPAVRIEDLPRFEWRGLMLDVARHFRTVDEVEALIDQMALHKLNRFHWHLTDDQGWRIEIKKYPQLTAVGGCRVPAGAAGRDPASGGPAPYCGYYTQQQIREVVKYAAERFVTVVPEVDLPGHAQAAIAAYPALGVTGVAPPVSPDWGVHTWLFNVDDGTFEFLQNVLTEVMQLFPSPYVHLGGDEAVKDQWQQSAAVQLRKTSLGLADEMALQGWFMGRLNRFLEAHGRRMIGWDEILESELPEQAIVMSWRGNAGAIAAARKGHDVILAPAPDLYMDHLQSDANDEQGGRLGVITLQDIYRFEPVPIELTQADPIQDSGSSVPPATDDSSTLAAHVLGAQVNLWTEHMRTNERVQQAAFPRAAALAEVVWSPKDARDWQDFLARLAPQMARYSALGYAVSDSAFAARIDAAAAEQGQFEVTIRNQTGFGELRYTLDGSLPTASSTRYIAPLVLPAGTPMTANAFAGALPLAAPRHLLVDVAAVDTRASAELHACHAGLVLRLEDDAPADHAGADRELFTIDIFDPCWIYEGADLGGVHALSVRVGQLPYNFQLWHDASHIVTRAADGPDGALEVRLDSCDGAQVAVMPLGAARRSDGLTELRAALPPIGGRHDLCFVFATGAHDPLWAIDRIELLR